MKPALVLSGGGARGAYQVGVLKAIADLHAKNAHNPFSIISGTSAGAVNAVALAASANNFRLAVKKVEKIWSNLHVDKVYRAGAWDLGERLSIPIPISSLGGCTWPHRPHSGLEDCSTCCEVRQSCSKLRRRSK